MASAASAGDSQLWLNGQVTAKVSGPWSVSEEVTARFSADRHGLYEIESNTLLGFRIRKNLSIWAGYTHDPLYSAGRFQAMEHRAREQLTLEKVPVARGRLSARFRAEQRWREGASGTGWRIRPYLRYTLPLHAHGPSLALSEEAFVDLNRTSFQSVRGLQRLRTFAGVSLPVGKSVTTEVGYLNQHDFAPAGKDATAHVLMLSLSISR